MGLSHGTRLGTVPWDTRGTSGQKDVWDGWDTWDTWDRASFSLPQLACHRRLGHADTGVDVTDRRAGGAKRFQALDVVAGGDLRGDPAVAGQLGLERLRLGAVEAARLLEVDFKPRTVVGGVIGRTPQAD